MVYNVNRGKGPTRTGDYFMATIEESSEIEEKKSEVPDDDLKEKVRKRYGG